MEGQKEEKEEEEEEEKKSNFQKHRVKLMLKKKMRAQKSVKQRIRAHQQEL